MTGHTVKGPRNAAQPAIDWRARTACVLAAFENAQGPEHSGRLGTLHEQKQAALRVSASSRPGAGKIDARASAGFMPPEVRARVVAWPKL